MSSDASSKASAFGTLDDATKAAIREAQARRKEQRKEKKKQKLDEQKLDEQQQSSTSDYPCSISSEDYFAACPGGLFRDPSLPPTERSLALLMRALDAGDDQAAALHTCQYFQWTKEKDDDELWDPRLNAKMAWEGFFTITTSRRGSQREPLPELQPYYGVLLWPNFESSRHVRKTLARLARDAPETRYVLRNNASPERMDALWKVINTYHLDMHGTNWLTRRYFAMMRAASDDPSINFTLHCIELCAEGGGTGSGSAAPPPSEGEAPLPVQSGGRVRLHGLGARADLNGTEGTALEFDHAAGRWAVRVDASTVGSGAEHVRIRPANLQGLPELPPPIAGEIGFSIGRVYTSLSGWTGARTADSVGKSQLVLLGRWLQMRGYAFWSLGHCYSPEMDYKRQLGHRIYPRQDFRALLHRHRGIFEVGRPGANAGAGDGEAGSCGVEPRFEPLCSGESCEQAALMEAKVPTPSTSTATSSKEAGSAEQVVPVG